MSRNCTRPTYLRLLEIKVKTGCSTRLRSAFDYIKGYDEFMKKYYRTLAFDRSKAAKLRLKALEFFEQFGLKATISAFKVNKATIYRWRKKHLDEQKRLVNPKIIEFIKNLRLTYGRLGKDKLKPLVDECYIKQGIESVSASTLGRIISDNKLFYQRTGRMYHNSNHKWAKQRKRVKRLRQRYAPKPKSFGHIEMDTLVKFVDGVKVYLITAIDVKLKFSFAQAYTGLNNKNALECFKKLQMVYLFTINTVQTDNGLDF